MFRTLQTSRQLLALLAAGVLCQSVAFAASPFTIAVIGDQQRAAINASLYTSFSVQTDWIAANAQADNIRFVTQVGDIIEHGNSLAQFTWAESVMATLDTATNADGGTGIPWNVNYGNHEVNWGAPGDDPAGADADNYRDYFGSGSGTHRYVGQPEYGGVSSNDLNTWHVISSSSAGGARQYLMLNLEYDVPGHVPGSTPAPGDVPAFDAIAWAQGIIDAYPGMPTVITTHVFEGSAFGPPNNPYTAGPGRNSQLQIFDKLVKDNSQVFMVFSGHTSQDSHQVKTNTAGLSVLQMVTDYTKVRPNAGDGWFRLVELDEDADEIRVKTYTPGVPQNPTPRFDTSANGEFTVALDWSTRFVPPPSGPIMGIPSSSAPTDDGATLQCQLGNADATSVTLAWAFDDQGETTVGTWSAASGGGSHAFGAAVTNDVLSQVLNGLDGDTSYQFRFFATDGVDSDWSNVASFVTGLGGLAAPSNFTGLPGQISGGTKVDLSWTDGYANETGFLIRRSTDAGFVTFDEFPVGADGTSYADETTDPNTTYYYRIAAVGSSGNGAFTGNLQVATGDAGASPVAGLIGHWKFDDASGTTAVDSSTSGYDLDRFNADGSWTTGKAGGAYNQARFTADATESDALNLPGGSVTVSVWVTAHNTSQFAGIAGLEGTGSTGDIYGFKMDNADRLNWTAVGASPQTSPDTLTTYAAATGDGWVHLVGTYDGVTGLSTIYVNGAPVISATQAAGIPDKTTPSLFRIGTYWNSSSYEFNGAIDDVQVYSEALTAADVTFLNSNPGSPLLGGGGSGPLMGPPSSTSPGDDGATLECQLLNADADAVTLVWAFADQGETDVATWTSAPGGGSYSFGAATQDDVLSHLLTGLDGDTGYSFRFFATAAAESDWSTEGSFSTGLAGGPAPSDLMAVAGTTPTTTKVDLTWTDSFTTETGFLIQRSTDPGFATYDEFPIAADETSYTDDTTAPNTTYHYRIAAVGSSGTGPFSAGVQATTGDNPSVPPAVLRGPYLQSASHDRITIRWRTDLPGTGLVRYGNSPGLLNQSTPPGTAETEHVVTITGLAANTTYYYEIETQNGAAVTTVGDDANHFFKTHPTPGASEPSRVWVIGDSGTTTAAKQNVYDAYRNRGEATDVWLMLGDNAYNSGTDNEFQAAVFDSYPELLRNTTLWSCIGNHEAYTLTGQPYLDLHSFPTAAECGGVASGSERYYSFDHGNIHFVCIDSETSGNYTDTPGGGGMVDWLELDLQATDKEWIIAYMHHGPYTKGSHDSDTETHHIVMRRYVTPLFEQYGVDLVLSGHSHCYERSTLINGHHSAMSTADSTSSTFNPGLHVVDPGNGSVSGSVDGTGTFLADGGDGVYKKLPATGDVGTVYSTCGASGKLSAWDNGSNAVVNPAPHPVFIVNLRVMGSMMLDVDGNTLHARYIDESNVVRDDFTIEKPGTGPFLWANSVTSVTDAGATLGCQLLNADANDVTLVWAYGDQGETDISTWTTAPGGGSYSFGAASEDDVLSHVLTGLSGDTSYSFRFLATAVAESDWSSVGSFATGLGGSPAPTILTAIAGTTATSTKVDLTWTDGFATETGFVIQRSTDPGFATNDEFSVGVDVTSDTDDTTAQNTTYYYRIAAVGTSGTGSFSSNATVTTGADPSGGGPVASLVGHWKFDDASGTTAVDSSTSGYDLGQVNGDGSWTTGKAGGAYQQARFTADATESDVLNLPGGSVTISVWVTAHNTSQFAGIAGLEGTGSTGDIYGFKMNNADKLNWTAVGASPQTSPDTLTTYAAATGDGWVHLVGTYDGVTGLSTVYVNGAPVISATQAAGIPDKTTPSLFRVGTYWNSSSYEFNGAIDDVQVYDEALTASDVTFLFNNPGSPLSAPTPGFADWIAGFSGLGGLTGFNDDPDGDNLANGLEAWFGTHPGEFNPGLTGIVTDATTTSFDHPANESPLGDVSGFYEWSPNLSDWFGSGSGPVAGPTVTLTPVTNGATTTVTATASEPLSRMFLRVGVTSD